MALFLDRGWLMTEISCALGKAAEKAGNNPAILGLGQTLSYREVDRWVSAVALQLTETGCRKGERIALLLPNDWKYLILLLALFRLEAVACPLNSTGSAARSLSCRLIWIYIER
jgi:acyl-CoA synthetase (AMP-forming)/AMP-acid ligase II